MKLAPKPTSTRPPQMKTVMLGENAMRISPAAQNAAPMRKLRFQPMTVPSRPPAIMSAPAMSEYTMFASWMSGTVAPSWVTSSVFARLSALFSPDVPIWAMIRMMMGRTRNLVAPSFV